MARFFGSLTNRINETVQSPEPKVGMGVTIYHYSDRTVGTITEVCTARKILVQEDKAIRTDNNGPSETQHYRYERNLKGRIFAVTKRKDGTWREVGGKMVFGLGKRDAYYDPCF